MSTDIELVSEKAFHGGRSFQAIGDDFAQLERHREVINADVLDAWFDPSPQVTAKLRRFLPFLTKTSPPVYAAGLVAAIASARNIPQECILVGGGSSDLIFGCFPHLIARGDRAMILDPMYGEYRHMLEDVVGTDVSRFELRKQQSFRVDTDAFIACAMRELPDLIVIVNPNSPTGQHWNRRELIRFIDSIPATITIVVDETYIEYAGPDQTLERETTVRTNVYLLKSMSKVYALSGLRVGYLVSSPANIKVLARWQAPWAVSLPAQVAAIEALSDAAYYAKRYEETHRLRGHFACDLSLIDGVHVYPSMTNLVLIETPRSAQWIVDRLAESNVFVRNCDSMSDRFNDRFIRIAVKDEMQNARIARLLSAQLQLRVSNHNVERRTLRKA